MLTLLSVYHQWISFSRRGHSYESGSVDERAPPASTTHVKWFDIGWIRHQHYFYFPTNIANILRKFRACTKPIHRFRNSWTKLANTPITAIFLSFFRAPKELWKWVQEVERWKIKRHMYWDLLMATNYQPKVSWGWPMAGTRYVQFST